MLEELKRAARRIPVDTRWLIAIVLALVSTVWLFVELSDEVLGRETSAFDRSVVRALREPHDLTTPRGPAWLPQAARDVTSLGGMAVLFLVIAAVTGFLALSRRFSSMWLVLISTLSGTAVSLALKNFFERPRPDFVPHLDVTATSSYPSGHAMLATVVYLTLGALLAQLTPKRRLKTYIVCTALGLAFLVGLTRVYLGVHYPTDVLGGWSAGVAWALCSGLTARLLRRRSPALQEEAQREHDERVEEEKA